MDFITPVFVFILVWWVVIFTVLPFGNKASDKPVIGHAASAPANPRLKMKLLWTTLIALLITAVIIWGMERGDLSIRNMVKTWSIE